MSSFESHAWPHTSHFPSEVDMPNQGQRSRLTNEQKLALLQRHEAFPEETLMDLSRWLKANYNLDYLPVKSTISTILNHNSITADHNPKRKSNKKPLSPEFEQQLLAWIKRCEY